tara:strand:+ start:55 stop:1182 length:1128 start_codon:yes stop_codon:yes gene_type:complete
MAQTIQIKRTAGTGKDSAVAQGELFYAYGSGGTYGKKLAIGHVNGGGNTPEIIGGSFFTDMLDHTAGTVTASSAIIMDSNNKIDALAIGNSSSQGQIELYEGSSSGTNKITLKPPSSFSSDITYVLPGTGITNGYLLSTDGSGNLSWVAKPNTLTVAADSGSNDTVTVGTDTLTFEGTANEIETTVSDNKINIGFPTNVTISGNLTVSGTTTTVSSTTVNVADSMLALATGNNSSDSIDIGFYGLYDDSGSQDEYSGFFRDAGDQKWKLFKNLQAAPTTTVDTSGTGYAVATLVADIETANAAISGGTITGITDLAVADGGTGLSSAAKGSVLVANSANTLSALDGGGSNDGILLYTSSSDTISWTTTLDGGTYS